MVWFKGGRDGCALRIGWAEGWVGGGMGLRVCFININDLYNSDLLPTSLLYISILLMYARTHYG